MIRQIFHKFIRDPLFQFLLLGSGLFIIYSVLNGPANETANRIVVEDTQAKRLSDQFQRTWMRKPTRQELQGLVEDFVKEEILYREARALGLDQDDLVIRRRLRQKMEFLNADLIEQPAPTEGQLYAYFEANKERFRRPDHFSFQQVYLNPYKPGRIVRRLAEELLVRLNTDPALAAYPDLVGDATMLPAQLDAVTWREVANTFGQGFAKDIENVPTGRWSGPYESSYGLHLVRITKRVEGSFPVMGEIRPILEREWHVERREEAQNSFYQSLRAHYEVDIRLPADDPAGNTLAVR